MFAKHSFQIYCEFGHPVHICSPSAEFPDWISQSIVYGSTTSINLRPNESQDFLGIILCFKHLDIYCSTKYTVKNCTSKFIWSNSIEIYGNESESVMVIVPRSIFSVGYDDDRIEITWDGVIVHGIHILYRTEISMIHEYKSTTINVEDEQCYPSKRSKHKESDKNLELVPLLLEILKGFIFFPTCRNR
ncbi:hypothetical protein POM88_020038 [Heracleum sosnowskyi]|uniref:Uncharacterized protein n=1 Tax=Heracleum sosnowskyi TaxID=360622 RepID=A0AAD8IDB9_9APIA|nr:hypothetical protein POM88_020038 [Heracleum sosnowskyi]